MAEKVPPVVTRKFYGINTWGNALERTPGSAELSENWRVMPDFWLQLRSGRRARMFGPENSTIRKIHTFRDPQAAGSSAHLMQRVSGASVEWHRFTVAPWVLDPFLNMPINQNFGGNFTQAAAAPSCNLRDTAVLYNGLGVRDITNSRPPFYSYNPQLRYFGLDAYCPNGNPEVGFASGEGFNSVLTAVKIFVGLHNLATGHFWNGVYAGTVNATSGGGVITVTGLDKLKAAWTNTAERNELFYVFYATIDGGGIPYPILDASLIDIYRVPATLTEAALSIYELGANGWVLDLTHEMPTDNHPPKPMSTIAYVNGRMYGVLKSGGAGTEVNQLQPDGTYKRDFSYVPADRYQTGLVYSKASSDLAVKPTQIGNPEESWPLTNFTPAPNAEVPIKVAPSPDKVRVLAITATATFLVTEAADAFHEWDCIAEIHGIAREECWVETAWGSIWLTQRNQVARYSQDYPKVSIISDEYDSVVRGKTPVCATYVVDPFNEVDQVRFYFTDGTCLIHDFMLRTPQFVHGQGYLYSGQSYTAGATITASDKNVYHLMAARHFYSVEGQPDLAGKVCTFDEDFGANDSTFTRATFTAAWYGQNDDFGDDDVRKDSRYLDLDGDEDVTVEWYPDRCQVVASRRRDGANKTRIPALETDTQLPCWRYDTIKAQFRWFRFVYRLVSNHAKYGDTYPSRAEGMSAALPLFGSIARVKHIIGVGANRA